VSRESETLEPNLSNYEKFVYLAVAAVSLWAGIAIWHTAEARMTLSKYSSGKTTLREWIDLDFRLQNTLDIGPLLWIVLVASLATWSFQIHKVVGPLTQAKRKWSRGWTIGGWVVPIGFVVIPYLVIRESLQILDGKNKNWNISALWWATSWISIFLGVYANAIFQDGSDPQRFYSVKLIQLGAVIVACLFAAFMVHESSISISEIEVEESRPDSIVEDQHAPSSSPPEPRPNEAKVSEIAESIRAISHLRAEGLLTQEEFELKKQQIINRI
jgi:hypothetical protein